MSYFSTTLTALLKGRTQAEVAKASGLPRSTIANYAIDTSGITVTALGQLLQAFPDREDQLNLVRAHLRDEIPADVYAEIQIHTSMGGMVQEQSQTQSYGRPWLKDLDRAFESLRVAAERDEDLRKLIIDLEKVVG